MALGRCTGCDELVTIVPGAHRKDSRQREWSPVDHDVPTVSDVATIPVFERCPGSGRAII